MRNKFLGTGQPGFNPWRKLKVIFSGLRYAVFYDLSVAYKVVLSVAVLVFAFAYRAWVDFLLVLLATAFMLAAEIFNSSVEAICDYLQTAKDEKIKAIKDMAAAATGMAILAWVLVIAFEILEIFGWRIV
ncbi:MAG: diacylglycerol kinase [Acidobacteriota bacterium]